MKSEMIICMFLVFLIVSTHGMSINYKTTACPYLPVDELKLKFHNIAVDEFINFDETKRLKFLNEVYFDFLLTIGFDPSYLQLKDCRNRLRELGLIRSFNQEAKSHDNESPLCEQKSIYSTKIFKACPHEEHISKPRSTITPSHRAFVQCVCRNCVGRLAVFPFSESVCTPVTTLMPALAKSSVSKSFNFFLEEVPTSCACQADLNG